jgi:Flp pilus assembly protein TadG
MFMAGTKKRNSRGHAVMEFAFFLPYLIFAFVGIFDWGNYAWALMKTSDAARVATVYTSSSSATAANSSGACTYVLAEMADAPNLSGVTTCSASPLTVTAAEVTGPDGNNASQVTVAYQTVYLIPIPGLLPGQLTITRVVEIPVRS